MQSTLRLYNCILSLPAFSGETVGWTRRFGTAAISKHFNNNQIERFTQANTSVIPYRILISADVATREEEEELQLAKEREQMRVWKEQLEAKEREVRNPFPFAATLTHHGSTAVLLACTRIPDISIY